MYGNNSYYPYQRPMQPQYQQQPSNYSQPVIHADIILASEQEAENFGVAAGQTQMFCARDDSAFFVKTAFPNGQYEFTVYERKNQKKSEKPYEELEKRISALEKMTYTERKAEESDELV